ncbi:MULTISPECIES: hypothetical protein [Alphaproteobacteria]|uniref:hypothetical protein n=1 Tax=Alphaproteobacteria TaxID=28211 RepID=UPI0014803651|nr:MULTISPECIES: hypothetical protein [Marinovum]MDD9739231.1 hypothetical protein [Marinovum sp. SP66]
MDEEVIKELTAAIKTLTHSNNVQSEILETLSARQADLIEEIKVLRDVIETSAKER